MPQLTIGIGECLVSRNEDDVLVTFALGTCIGVVAYDSVFPMAGMVHCQLPMSSQDPEQAARNPARYVDSGVGLLLQKMLEMGSKLERIVVVAAGCAMVNGTDGIFKIAQRNHSVFRKLMWKNDLLISAEDIGGERPRNLQVSVDTGRVVVTKDQKPTTLFDPSSTSQFASSPNY